MIPNYYPLDPRTYLREELDVRQKRRPQYSLRAFARDLEISPSFLCEFLAGRQGLSRARVSWISEKLKLTGEQAEHFWDLVQSQFASSAELKKAATYRVKDRVKTSQSHLTLERFHLIADWYHFVLLEVLGLPNAPSLPKISEILDVPVKDLEVAIDRLKRLGLLSVEMTDVGPEFKVCDEMTSVGGEVSDRAVQLSHQQTLRMHAEAVDRKPFAERENMTMAFSVAQKDWPALRKEVKKAVFDVVAKHGGSKEPKDQVVSFTMQMITLLDNGGVRQ